MSESPRHPASHPSLVAFLWYIVPGDTHHDVAKTFSLVLRNGAGFIIFENSDDFLTLKLGENRLPSTIVQGLSCEVNVPSAIDSTSGFIEKLPDVSETFNLVRQIDRHIMGQLGVPKTNRLKLLFACRQS